MPIYIIEHLDRTVYQWSFFEYRHISKLVGKKNLWITHTKSSRLKEFAKIIPQSVLDLDLKNACILDPLAEETLTPEDNFEYYIFGGILGDDPPTEKTKKFLSSKSSLPTRNLEPEQMATDNAVYMTKLIADGTPIESIPVVTDVELDLREGESVILPYKYVLVNGKPLICKAIMEKLKKGESF
ncbi:hypothetical protein GF342_04315 [Candidatus Woesearchaeota archaeon]|nr:hypothetical protein [Candidatus Woesearchaeota archaeon]